MRDGVELLADRYFMENRKNDPVVVMRCPYGRGAIFGMMAALIAERGFQVVLQSVRGTAGSGGQLNPMRKESTDGADTLAWIKRQPWFTGRIFAFGGSYLGNAVWAMAREAGDEIDGAALSMTLSNFRDELHGSGGFTQAGTLAWTQTELIMSVPGQKMKRPKPGSLDHAHRHLPVGAIDQAAFGQTVSWWQEWVNHEDPDDPWWKEIDHSAAVSALRAPVAMTAGWQDIFLPFQLRDFEARQAAGQPAWITIGPWGHAALGGMVDGLRQAITLFKSLTLREHPYLNRSRVRLYLQGAGEWRDYPSWPPMNGRPLQFYLRAGGRLDVAQPGAEEGLTRYVYDPFDPTPSVHGPMVMGGGKVRDMSALESRSDTVLFTSDPLERDIDVVGPVTVNLAIRSDREHTDFYVCFSDVDAKGRSMQVLDGYLRLRPGRPQADASGVRHITIDCWPTAYRFKRGHKVRLIIASGAHPRYARNLGTGEPIATATNMVPAHQEILHDLHHLSSISLLEAGGA